MSEKSAMYDECKWLWDNNYTTEAQMRRRVALWFKKKSKGISPEEFEEITGIPY